MLDTTRNTFFGEFFSRNDEKIFTSFKTRFFFAEYTSMSLCVDVYFHTTPHEWWKSDFLQRGNYIFFYLCQLAKLRAAFYSFCAKKTYSKAIFKALRRIMHYKLHNCERVRERKWQTCECARHTKPTFANTHWKI